MSTQMTPLPWTCKGGKAMPESGHVFDLDGRLVAGCRGHDDSRDRHQCQLVNEANAQFIVHACNLHDELVAGFQTALACLTSQVKYVTDNRQAYGHNQDATDILKSLLAKAQ